MAYNPKDPRPNRRGKKHKLRPKKWELLATALYSEGRSHSFISEYLNAKKFKPTRGEKFTPQTLTQWASRMRKKRKIAIPIQPRNTVHALMKWRGIENWTSKEKDPEEFLPRGRE